MSKGNFKEAINLFKVNLAKFREVIQKKDKADPDFWNPRVKNLMEDIDE